MAKKKSSTKKSVPANISESLEDKKRISVLKMLNPPLPSPKKK